LDVNGDFRLANFASGSTNGFFNCADTGSITLNFGGTTTPAKGRIFYSDNSDLFAFYTNSTERARIPSTGGIQSVNSISVGNATPTTSGAGITFPATQSASSDANTLDDYEEGTWTPVYQGSSGSAGTAAYTSSGSYTKIGRLVNLNCRLDITNVGSWTGNFQISGSPFPFTAGNSGADFHGVTRIAFTTFGALVSYYVARLPATGNLIDLVGITTAAQITILPTSALSSSSVIIVELTYFV
jgi:hypothetical protein